MTIITAPRCFEGYPLTALPQDLVDRLRASSTWRNCLGAVVIRLQAFCELTGRTLVGLEGPAAKEVLEDFAAAFFGSRFSEPSMRATPWARLLVLRRALPEPLRFYFPCSHNQSGWDDAFRQRFREFDQVDFEPIRSEFWTGWIAENAAGGTTALCLHRFWKRFGPDRTRELVNAARIWFSKGRFTGIPIVEDFADYLVTVDEVDFQDSTSLGQIFQTFAPRQLHAMQKRGMQVTSLIRSWHLFVDILSNHLLGEAWASPVPAIPNPRIPHLAGSKTNLRKTSEGYSVKVALVTPVPLHVTDTEAKELLFRDIRREANALLAWARHEVREARLRLARRKTLAPTGIVSVVGLSHIATGLRYRLSRECEEHLAHAAATFERRGFDYRDDDPRSPHMIFPMPLAQTAWELGLPTPGLLLAHATVLVREHPIITPSFLEHLELFDAEGRQVGLVYTDAGAYLRSVKRRKGPRLAEQDILLTAETLEVVRDLIALTEPLRAWLRARGNKYWRRLFLAVATMGAAPTRWVPSSEASGRVDWLAERFAAFSTLARPEDGDVVWLGESGKAHDLATRFSLKRLRSSAGVLIYLETGSVERMAKALGHATWRPTLLDRYLPRPIQEFFLERWIRLFQTGIICEALRNSPYLLEATPFSTMAELDAFLEHHALRRIPAHLESPDQVGGNRSSKPGDRVVFGIEVGILTILVSLETAVRKAKRDPCGRAIRWARISERLMPHLESQAEQPEFRAIVAEARRRADPTLVEALIYG